MTGTEKESAKLKILWEVSQSLYQYMNIDDLILHIINLVQELIDVEGDRVLVSFRGACANCPTASFTIANVVEPKLREFVSGDLFVEDVCMSHCGA